MADRDPSLPDLTGHVTLITGASGGIGHGIARRFAAAGAAIVAQYRSTPGPAQTLVKDITAGGGQAVTVPADITSSPDCHEMVARAIEQFGRLDTLVNNAGVQPVHALDEMTADQWRDVIDTNLTGTMLASRAAAAVMPPGSSIVTIASIEALRPTPGHAHYAASKAGVVMHARAAAAEYGPRGIRVNTVSPGLIDRDGLADSWPEGVDRYRRAAPLGRIGTARDIGDACVFLASPMAAWITGQNLVVDGGVSATPAW